MSFPHFVMKHWDPMIGIDFHMPQPPPAPAPLPAPVPVATLMFVSGMGFMFSPNTKHHSVYGVTVEKGTDIGTLIPHIPCATPSILLPLETIFSSSKSHFGSAKYKYGEKTVALDLLVSTNPNLNCGTPVPTPTGFVITFTTHGAGMTWGDVGAGFGAMFGDFVLQSLLNMIGLKYGKGISGWLATKLGPVAGRLASKLPPALASKLTTAVVTEFLKDKGMDVVNFLFGGPMGMDIGTFGVPTIGGKLGEAVSGGWEKIGRALGEAADGGPSEGIQPADL